MKELKILKADLLENKYEHFYIFTGNDYGLKHHYLERLKLKYKKIKVVDTVDIINQSLGSSGASLFKLDTLYLVYNDEEFLDKNKTYIQGFIDKCKSDCVVISYDIDVSKSTMFKEFENYITDFSVVVDKIALEFVASEVNLSVESSEELAFNCANDYNTIRLEADKIRSYAEAMGVTHQVAYDDLKVANQLVYRDPPFSIDDFLNAIILCKKEELRDWWILINRSYADDIWMRLTYIVNNFLIAYMLKKNTNYSGSSNAYKAQLPWGRIKTLRDCELKLPDFYYLDIAIEVAKIDELVKSGRLSIDKVFDYFMCVVF